MVTLWSFIWPVLLGIAGWLVINFVASPLIRFKDMRREIERARITLSLLPIWTGPAITARDEIHPSIAKRELAKDELRRLSVDMMSFGTAEPIAPLLAWFGFDPKLIGAKAATYANFADTQPEQRLEREKDLLRALRIPYR